MGKGEMQEEEETKGDNWTRIESVKYGGVKRGRKEKRE
jgi:hypothetical protein